jgi:hypothetical protein
MKLGIGLDVHGCTNAAEHKDVRERPCHELHREVQLGRSAGMRASRACTRMC